MAQSPGTANMQPAVETRSPIQFEPDVERAYALQMPQRFTPLGWLASAIGLAAFTAVGSGP